MSKRTLSDELQSVLLARSFDAPDAEDTIARTLAQTVDKATLAKLTRRRWRPNPALFAGAAVLVVAVGVGAGFVKLTHDNGRSATSSSMKAPAQDEAGAAPSYGSTSGGGQANGGSSMGAFGVHPQAGSNGTDAGVRPPGLTCPAGASSSFSFVQPVNVGSEPDLVVSAQCLSANGVRTASEVYTTAKSTSESGKIRATIIQQSDGLSVQSISTGPSTVTVRALQLASGSIPESLQEQVYRTTDGGQSYLLKLNTELAEACRPDEVSAEVIAGAGSSAVLTVRNTGTTGCVISGYPGTGSTSLRGPNGGVAAELVPIVLLNPGETASASIDQPARPVPCPSAPPTLYLPTGAALTDIDFQTQVNCQPVLHPFVAGSTGRA